jgi:PmbA protein
MHRLARQRGVLLKMASSVSDEAEILGLGQSTQTARMDQAGSLGFHEGWSGCLGVRIIRDGMIGMGTRWGSTDLPEIVDLALASARTGARAGFSFPGPSEPAALQTSHPQLESVTMDDLAGMILQIRDFVCAGPGRSTLSGTISRRRTEVFLDNSAGFSGSYSKTCLDFSLEIVTRTGPGTISQALRFSTGLPPAGPESLCGSLLERAGLPWADPPQVSSDLAVVVTPAVLATLLQALRAGVSGAALASGSTPLAGMEGRPVASGLVSVLDRPRLPCGAASAPFDAEGVPTSDRYLLRSGVFEGFVHSLSTGASAGVPSTGSAGRSGEDPPFPVCTNLVMETGGDRLDELLGRTGDGLMIAGLLPGGYGNALSGSFSFECSCAVVTRDGVPAAVSSGWPVSGNTWEMLARVEAVEDSLHSVETDWLPHVLARGITAGIS